MLIFALMGIGPLLPWRKADEQSLTRNLVWLVSAAALTGGVAYALGVHKLYPLLTVALAAYNLVSIWLLLRGAVAPRMRLSGRGFFPVFAQYASEKPSPDGVYYRALCDYRHRAGDCRVGRLPG